MGKLILISGSNGSGKSRFAESLLADFRSPRYYVATMVSTTEENRKRIQKHIVQRDGLRFQTLELPARVGDAPITSDSTVLLEDVSNLLGNAWFGSGCDEESVFEDILTLQGRCELLVAVTIGGLQDRDYSGETADYIRRLNDLNDRLYRHADAAAEMVDGHAVWRKVGNV